MPHPIPSRDPNGPRVHVQFFIPEVPFETDLDAKATREQGRPIYRTREYVRIINPSDPLNKPVHPAHEKIFRDRHTNAAMSYAEAYPEEYRAFKAGQAEQIIGTPLTELTSLTAAKRHELKALEIVTVESLASLDGAPLKRLGMEGNALKSMAQAYLDRAKEQAVDARFAAENAALRAEMEALRNDLKAIKSGKAEPEPDANDENPPEPGPFDTFSDDDLKVYIKSRTGEAPRGRVSRETLLRTASELMEAEKEAA